MEFTWVKDAVELCGLGFGVMVSGTDEGSMRLSMQLYRGQIFNLMNIPMNNTPESKRVSP